MLTDQDLLYLIFESKDALAIYDSPELHIRFVNAAMLQIWGKDKSVVGKTFEQAIPEIAGQPFTGLLKNVWLSGEAYRASDMAADLIIDGQLSTFYFDFEYRPMLNQQGQTYAILHTATDVSARKLARLQQKQLTDELAATNTEIKLANKSLMAANDDLRLSNEQVNRLNRRLLESDTNFKRLVEQSPVAILVFRGPEMVIQLANQAMLEILGKDSSIIGQPLLSGMPELKGEPAVELLFDIYHKGISSDGNEVPVRMQRDGQLETRYFNFSYRPLKDNDTIIGVMDIAVEVTGQVLARQHLEAIIAEKTVLESSLRGNEQRLQRILDTMAEGIVIVDADCKPTYANPMAQKIIGIGSAEFTDRNYSDTKWQNLRPDGAPLPLEDHPMYVVLRTGLAVYDQEIAVLLPTGEKIYISINAAPLLDEHQQITGGIATFTDVTNRRKVLQEKEDFISVASHELRTPVTSLKASLQLLERMQHTIKPEMLAKLLAQANKSLNKLSDLINSLLNTNRISQGRFPIHKTTFSVAGLINESCQHILAAGTHTITINGDTNLQIAADEQQLGQVLTNLLNNAVKYAPQSKDIFIEVQKMADRVKISVTDLGPGISPEQSRHIFERYYRANDGHQASGLGLGLYISAEIIEKHSGEIGVHARAGGGSTFWFTVPLNSDPLNGA